MNWEQVRNLYLKACGNTPDALNEQWDHINFAYRRICGGLELPELHLPNAIVTTTAEQDYVDIDCDVYSLDWIVNKATGRKLDPEPGGSRGRARFFEQDESRPPLGSVNFYVRRGSRIWLRDCPPAGSSGAIDLIVSFRFHPPEVTEENLAEHPIVPPQYDMALVKVAAGNFFSLHPPMAQDGRYDLARGQQLAAEAEGEMQRLISPVVEEQKDRRDSFTQPGYSFNAR